MLSLKRSVLLVLPVVILLWAVACAEDPTATPTSAPTPTPVPTATPTAAPTPTPTAVAATEAPPPEPAAEGPVTYTLDEIRIRDTVFELRMGDTLAWGYGDDPRSAEADRIRTDEVGDITITINVGDTLVFPDGLTGSGSAAQTHFITIDEFGINAAIAPGADTNLGLTITPTQGGTFRVYCSAHPDPAVHGNFWIVVQGGEGDGGGAVAAEAVTYVLDEVRMRDEAIELRMGPTTAWGFLADTRVRTDEVGDITITINAGDTLEFPDGFTGSSGNTITHFFVIEELGINLEVPPGVDTNLGYTITPTEPGTYRAYDSAAPELGSIFIVVEEPRGAGPVAIAYTLDQVRMRDEAIELRMGPTEKWGFAAEQRVRTDEEGYILITIFVGDSLVFPGGLTGSSDNAITHIFTIDELGVSVPIGPGEVTNLGFTIAPTEPGPFFIYDAANPDLGSILIVVK